MDPFAHRLIRLFLEPLIALMLASGRARHASNMDRDESDLEIRSDEDEDQSKSGYESEDEDEREWG